MPQITLLHASEDITLAEQLERQLLHANSHIHVVHNNNASYGTNINDAWKKTLHTSHLFIVLVSADLSNSERTMHYISDVIRVESGRLIPIYVRPCMLDDGHIFKGYKVVPEKAITSYTGAKKEAAWLQVVRFILDELADVEEPAGYVAPHHTPEPPYRKFARQRVATQAHPLFIETPIAPVVRSQPALIQEKREMDVVVLSAPQDKAWLPYVDRTLKILSRGLPVTFVIRHNPDDAHNAALHADVVLILLSPDFLASKYLDLYHEVAPHLLDQNRQIIPVLIRECAWDDTVSIPRNGAIRKTSNDAAWGEVSNEIRKILNERE